MLKDILKNNFTVLMGSRAKYDLVDRFKPIHGVLEVFGWENGKLFHYDNGSNTITRFGKHAMMHVLTGESFAGGGASYGNLRAPAPANHYTAGFPGDSNWNNDGTLISNYQYFDSPTFPGSMGWWSKADSGISGFGTYLYPFFPTKMLFGTGYEFPNFTSMGADFQAYYNGVGITSSTWAYVGDATNTYSNNFGGVSGDSMVKCKTINDIYSTTLSTPVILDSDFGIPGAIKDGIYHSDKADSQKLQQITGSYYSNYNYWGVGKPSFVYCRRESRFYQSGSEVGLDFDSDVENKITYTVTLPEQVGSSAGKFYPYNGFVLKVAGLFCDARFFLRDFIPANDAQSLDSGLQEYKNYLKMPGGMLIAKRYIAPITKSASVSITFRWTLYL